MGHHLKLTHLKLVLTSTFVALCLSFPLTGSAGPYEDGETAFKADKYKQALPLFTKAAEENNPMAQFYIGNMYEFGLGVTQSYEQAVFWYEKAVAQGEDVVENGSGVELAQYNFGVLLLEGKGTPKSAARAFELFQKAANTGNAAAQNNLGLMYAKGEHVAASSDTAMEWFQESADLGNANGMKNLATGYYYGVGIKQSNETAISWYKQAAALGNKEAKYMLAKLGVQ